MKDSTKPEGATSYKETVFGIIPRSKLLKLELSGTKKGLDFIGSLAKQSHRVRITPELICKLHKISFGWIFPKWTGKYRKILVSISGKEATPYFKIPELILNLCNDLDERLRHLPKPESKSYVADAAKLLAWFQHKFVLIHPFQDYNGRTARMLTILLLLQLDMPPIEIKVESANDRNLYLLAMQEADKGNLSPLENIIGQAVTEALEKILSQRY